MSYRNAPLPTSQQVAFAVWLGRVMPVGWRTEWFVPTGDSGGYHLDIACPRYQIDVELDGGVHSTPDRISRDAVRDEALTTLGWRVVRLRNDQLRGEYVAATRQVRAALDAAMKASAC